MAYSGNRDVERSKNIKHTFVSILQGTANSMSPTVNSISDIRIASSLIDKEKMSLRTKKTANGKPT